VKVQHSTTPRSEKCTDLKLARQWNSFDWKAIKFRVNRLQTRIAKATHNENWNLVKRLTYFSTSLTRNRDSKIKLTSLAV